MLTFNSFLCTATLNIRGGEKQEYLYQDHIGLPLLDDQHFLAIDKNLTQDVNVVNVCILFLIR